MRVESASTLFLNLKNMPEVEENGYGRHDDGHDFAVTRPIDLKPLPYRVVTQQGTVIEKELATSSKDIKNVVQGGW